MSSEGARIARDGRLLERLIGSYPKTGAGSDMSLLHVGDTDTDAVGLLDDQCKASNGADSTDEVEQV